MHPRELLRTASLLLTALGCGDSTSDSGQDADSGTSFCERYSVLATEIGCDPVSDCSKVTPDCDGLAQVWLDCVVGDVSQCLCESDGEINCEGSYKPDEGPALCIDEMTAFQACVGE